MSDTASDLLFMQRALELATLGKGAVSPNPLVGCVIVHEGRIIGEGWHERYGGPHAEVNAVKSVANKALLKESTVYVTLEPCAHFGKTPPCADMLVREQVKQVVVCNADPFPLVDGRGIEKLRAAGIAVETGLMEDQGRVVNKRFFTFIEKKRPYILLKWAETADGFIAPDGLQGHDKQISNALAQALVHKMRAEEDAVLVGTNTALLDNPQLNVRHWHGRNPVRVVIDRHLRLPPGLHLFDGSQPTLCYNLIEERMQDNLAFVKLSSTWHFISEMLEDLYSRNIQSLIVEGGTQLLRAFLEAGLWDEAWVFKAEKTFGSGTKAPTPEGKLVEVKELENNRLFYYLPTSY